MMWKWLAVLMPAPAPSRTIAPAGARAFPRATGRFVPFQEYINNRFADTFVLTFDDIEDISGFPLPDRARTDQQWWTSADADPSAAPYVDAWARADRSARVNMGARTVTFERL